MGTAPTPVCLVVGALQEPSQPEEIAAFSAWLEAEADDAGPWRSDMLSEDWDE